MKDKIGTVEEKWVWNTLQQTPFPPKILYMRGTLPPKDHSRITIVGSRVCSEYGKQVINEICTSLSGYPVSIISGLAHGIDTYVHTCALTHNLHTIAIVGSGLSDKVLYPKSNLELAHSIIRAGGTLLSEQKPDTISRAWMFPARNRIMAALADIVIIVEAKEKSGTLITARLAVDYNKEVMTVPHSIYSPFSKGSNQLLKQGAHVYTGPEDLFELLPFIQHQKTLPYNDINLHKHTIIKAITHNHTTTEQLVSYCTDISIPLLIQNILELELEGYIKKVDGQYIILTK